MAPRIAVMGTGGIGAVVGGMLAHAGHDVTLVDQWSEHMDAVKRDGLLVSTLSGDFQTRPKALRISEIQGVGEPFDMVFVTSVVRADTDSQRPMPWSAPSGESSSRKPSAIHWAAPVSFIWTPRDMAAA